MSTYALWFMLLPVIGTLLVVYLNREHIGDWRSCLFVGGTALVVGMLVVGVTFAVSYGSQVSDTEIINGQVVSKKREHGSYTRTYSCMCTTDSKGNTTCQTCTEHHYTVDWTCSTTVGDITIDSEDWTNRGVYLLPDPPRWKKIWVGEPVAAEHTYTNYVQAVPNSLFHPLKQSDLDRHAKMLPAYPQTVFDFYRINRFFSPGFHFDDADKWNEAISMGLRELGPRKQVNAIVVIARTPDPTYAEALRQHWEGANKNDVVLVIGTLDAATISWVRVISWTNNELFKIELRDRIQDLGAPLKETVLPVLFEQINRNFERRRMREFEYLKGQIDPSDGLLIGLIVVLVGGYTAFHFVLRHQHGTVRRRFSVR